MENKTFNMADEYQKSIDDYLDQVGDKQNDILYQIGHLSHLINHLSRKLWQEDEGIAEEKVVESAKEVLRSVMAEEEQDYKA